MPTPPPGIPNRAVLAEADSSESPRTSSQRHSLGGSYKQHSEFTWEGDWGLYASCFYHRGLIFYLWGCLCFISFFNIIFGQHNPLPPKYLTLK